MRIAVVTIFAAAAASSVAAQPLQLQRDGVAASVSVAELQSLPHLQVHVDQHGHAHDFGGVPLGTVLAKVGVNLSQPLSGSHLADVVRVTSSDGYQVVLALSEVDPATRSGQVIIADSDGGKPLTEGEGPFRLVVSDDLRPARSARQISLIEVLSLSTSVKGGAGRH